MGSFIQKENYGVLVFSILSLVYGGIRGLIYLGFSL